MTVGIYARISTDDSKQNIQQQIDKIKEFCKDKQLEVYWTYTDKQSGKDSSRKGYNLMLKHGQEKRFSSLIVLDIDRLTRNFYDAVKLEKWLIENQIALHSLSEAVDLKTANGRAMFRMKLVLSALYVENLREKIKIGVERAKKQGLYKGRKRGSKNRLK